MIKLQWQPKWKLISFEIIFKKKNKTKCHINYFLMDLRYKNYIHNFWFWYILVTGSISFRIHSKIEKKGTQRVKGWRMCSFTIGECTVKLTPRTTTIVYLSTVIGGIHNNSQEAGRYSWIWSKTAQDQILALSLNIFDLDKLLNLFYASVSSSVKYQHVSHWVIQRLNVLIYV